MWNDKRSGADASVNTLFVMFWCINNHSYTARLSITFFPVPGNWRGPKPPLFLLFLYKQLIILATTFMEIDIDKVCMRYASKSTQHAYICDLTLHAHCWVLCNNQQEWCCIHVTWFKNDAIVDPCCKLQHTKSFDWDAIHSYPKPCWNASEMHIPLKGQLCASIKTNFDACPCLKWVHGDYQWTVSMIIQWFWEHMNCMILI